MQNNTNLLDVMLEDQMKAQDLYKPCAYWEGYSLRTANAIRADGIETFRGNSRIGKGYADTALMDPFDLLSNMSWKHKVHRLIRNSQPFKKYFVDPYIKQINSTFKRSQQYKDLYYTHILGEWFAEFSKQHDLPDTLVGNPLDVVSINGHKIGLSYLVSFLRVHNYSKSVDLSKVTSVFEIGGGFGSFAHTLMHLYPNIKKYVYLDIPPTVYVGTQYLKHFYPDNVIDYTQTRTAEKIAFSGNDEREILSICPWQIEQLDINVDLFWNSASFQEMTEEVVTNYSQNLKRFLHDKSKVCLMTYKIGNAAKTISPERVVELVEAQTNFSFKELGVEMDINDDRHFIGEK